MSKKWKAVATYRYTHDKVIADTGEFDDFEDIEAWLHDPRVIENVVITFNANDERLTLVELSPLHAPDVNKGSEESLEDAPNAPSV